MLPAELRTACAGVASRARSVRVNESAVPAYALDLSAAGLGAPGGAAAPALITDPHERERAAAETLILDAINFGSGWFPTLRKRDGLSGYRTIAKGLATRFGQHGPWRADELTQLEATTLAATLDQDPDHPLIPLFVASLRDLGERTGSAGFAAVVDAAGASAITLVETLSRWPCFDDTSSYDELQLPFLKRAQISANDLHHAGVAHFTDLDQLTIFADNLVPHVLKLDGILTLDPALDARIEREELLQHGSHEEVELRACAVHAAELIVSELARAGQPVTAAELDTFLWERGGAAPYKARPRPRSRTTAY